jgi:tripartite motif-containing protein 71
MGMAIDGEGNVWAADKENNRIEKFNSKGEYLSQFGTSGSGNGQFSKPYDVAIDKEGNIWVTDRGNSQVEKFNSKGEYLLQFGSLGNGNGQFRSGRHRRCTERARLGRGQLPDPGCGVHLHG